MAALEDPGSHEGLKAALQLLDSSGGWDGPAGRAVLEELRVRCHQVACQVTGRPDWSDRRAVGLRDELWSEGWLYLSRHGEALAEKPRPWSVVMGHLRHVAVRSCAAAALLVSTEKIRLQRTGGVEQVRVVDPTDSAQSAQMENAPHRQAEPTLSAEFSEALSLIGTALVDAGVDREKVTVGMRRVLELMEISGDRKRLHERAYGDAELSSQFSHDEIRGLVNLLAGTRRGGHESSALAAALLAVRDRRAFSVATAYANARRDLDLLASPAQSHHQWALAI